MHQVNSYYLQANLIGLIITLCAYLASPGLRKSMLISSLSLLPASALSMLHEETYWNPQRINGGKFGIEDVIFCFSVGSLIWFAGAFHMRDTSALVCRARAFIPRLLAILIPAATFLAILFLVTEVNIMLACIITQITITASLAISRKASLSFGFSAALAYTIYYNLMLGLFFSIFPGFADAWAGVHIWKEKILGLPLEEICWVFTFGLAWSMTMAYAFGLPSKTHLPL